MKSKLIVIALLYSYVSQAQNPVNWRAVAEKTAPNTYLIKVTGAVKTGWHVYATADTAKGLEQVSIQWNNESILRSGKESPGGNSIQVLKDPLFDHKPVKVYNGAVTLAQPVTIKGTVPASFLLLIKGFASDNTSFVPLDTTVEVSLEGGMAASTSLLTLASVDLDHPASSCGGTSNSPKSLLTIFFLGFLGGMLALLTPCVFPMIPVTVSFFTGLGKSKKRAIENGILYGISIAGIYVLASVPFHLLGNISPQLFNTISTSAWVNIFFFIIFILFALSLFGIFNVSLPPAIANSTGSRGGIFFMALTLAIVSFSCTGPILGSLLVGSLSSEGGAWQLTSGMLGFGMALALPFAIFALFPGWLKTLPKSGGWMEVVKKSLAFVELALAIKFLSNADLVTHRGLPKREVFIGLWILIAMALSLYLLGVFKRRQRTELYLAGKDNVPRISPGRRIAGVIVLAFAVYMLPGLTNSSLANLKLLSGFPPPLNYSVYSRQHTHNGGVESQVINDYDAALRLSREQHKPILIDFTGWACVNCRKMEEQVWTKPAIAELINDKFILVSLYVDDRGKL